MEELKVLVLKAKDGDKDAFSEIYKLYFKKVYRYCRINVYDQALAQDICQESFVKAWKSIKHFEIDKPNWSIQAFLFTIARNLIIDNSRKKKNTSIENYEHIDSGEDPYEKLDRITNIKNVQEALSRLEEEERQIIILRYFEELDSKEVSKILGVKDGALRVRQFRIMQKLKRILEVIHEKRN